MSESDSCKQLFQSQMNNYNRMYLLKQDVYREEVYAEMRVSGSSWLGFGLPAIIQVRLDHEKGVN